MKRREAKFVHASPRMFPDQIKATPRLREDGPRPVERRVRDKTSPAVAAVEHPKRRNRAT